MKLEEYFSIPQSGKKQYRYVGFLSLIISVAVGTLVILDHKMFIQNATDSLHLKASNSDFIICVLLLLSVFCKLPLYINYRCKVLEEQREFQTSLRRRQIIIPCVIKFFLYLGLIKTATFYLKSFDGTALVLVNAVVLEYFRVRVFREAYRLRHTFIVGAALLGQLCVAESYQFEFELVASLFLFSFGSLAVVAYFDLLKKVFEIYKPQVEELVAKSLFTEMAIYSLYILLCLLDTSQLCELEFLLINFGWVLAFLALSVFVQYSVLEFIRKNKVGKIVFTVLSALFWTQIYFIRKKGFFEVRDIVGLIFLGSSCLLNIDILSVQSIVGSVSQTLQRQRRKQDRIQLEEQQLEDRTEK